MFKKIIVSVALAVGLSVGGGMAYGFSQMDAGSTGGSAVTGSMKYSPKGSGFHRVQQPRHYHNYWTGGKKYRQNDK